VWGHHIYPKKHLGSLQALAIEVWNTMCIKEIVWKIYIKSPLKMEGK
jgi:hypothetical protein